MTLFFDEKFDLSFLFEIQVILSQAPCVLNDKFFSTACLTCSKS